MFGKLKLGSSADCLDSEILGALRGERARAKIRPCCNCLSPFPLWKRRDFINRRRGGGRENELASFGLEEKHESASHSGGETEIRFGMKFHFPRRKVSSLPYIRLYSLGTFSSGDRVAESRDPIWSPREGGKSAHPHGLLPFAVQHDKIFRICLI